MGYIKKYIRMVPTSGMRILKDWPKFRKMAKHKDKYPYEERYAKAMDIIKYVTNDFPVKFNVQGLEKVPKENLMFVVNHQSYFDPFISQILDRKIIWVAKQEIRKMPFIGNIAECLDTIFFVREEPREAVKMIQKASDVLKEGKSLWVSIEGTRSKKPDHSMNEFKPGSLKPAYNNKTTIVPMVICGSWKVLSPKYCLKEIPVDVVFFDPIKYEDYKDLSTQQLSDKLYKMMKEVDDKLLIEQNKK